MVIPSSGRMLCAEFKSEVKQYQMLPPEAETEENQYTVHGLKDPLPGLWPELVTTAPERYQDRWKWFL